MKLIHRTIECRAIPGYQLSKRTQAFRVVCFVFDYQSSEQDRKGLDTIINNADDLARLVNPGSANASTQPRKFQRVMDHCVAGLLAEYAWHRYLNVESTCVASTEMTASRHQIDLRVLATGQSIEVRASFPKNGLEFALCHPVHQFDVIGPYCNQYKPSEPDKDFYVRTLFPFETGQILDKIREDRFIFFLAGGATWEMMCDPAIAVEKDFIPEGEYAVHRLDTKSAYRVVPFEKALDTVEIANLIRQGCVTND